MQDSLLPCLQDLFIIDQHASDEKYNFERLAASTTLNRQPLLHPEVLDLNPHEVQLLLNNQEVRAESFRTSTELTVDPPLVALMMHTLPAWL